MKKANSYKQENKSKQSKCNTKPAARTIKPAPKPGNISRAIIKKAIKEISLSKK